MNTSLTRIKNFGTNKKSGLFSFFWITVIILTFQVEGLTQASISRTVACSCLNNGAPSGQAQFEEEITVLSGTGENWYISSISGFYQSSSPVPPASPVPFIIGPNGEQLVENNTGEYVLRGLHFEDIGYSITLTNGTISLSLDNILCSFPSGNIIGDNAICGTVTELYQVENPDPNYSYSWDISGQGTIIGASDGPELSVLWDDDAIGFSTINLNTSGPTGCTSTSQMLIEFETDITLACNNQINIAVSADCIIEVNPDDVLENMQYNDESYIIYITDPETGDTIQNGSLASNVLFDTLHVSIFHICSENSCWGEIVFEDKYAPPLECENDTIRCDLPDGPNVLGFPLPSSAEVTSLGDQMYLVEDFDPCGDAELSYVDNAENFECDEGDFITIVTRTWTLIDFSGSISTCDQFIYKTRSTVLDIDFPLDWDGGPGSNPAISCEQNIPLDNNGYPDPSFTGEPSGAICDHISFTYSDLYTEICGATYKVVRKWTVTDHCTGQSRSENQLIKVEDNEAPEFLCPGFQTFTLDTYNSCETTVSVQGPTNITDCSDVSISAQIVSIDDQGSVNGPVSGMTKNGTQWFASNRGLGRHRITFIAIDECGLTSTCSFEVEIIDNIPPTAVCDITTTIALDNGGKAIVPVSTFDNGSYDNCGIDKIEISRGPNSCGSSGFGESITLCCDDANKEVMVTLKVTDLSGNVNTCMVVVNVQDKKAPVISCPSNISVTCTTDLSNLSQFGTATATDNCDFVITENVINNINSCGIGSITRIFTAKDDAGNESSCSQLITVFDNNPLSLSDIVWPGDYTTEECINPELHPDDLPFNNAYPQISNNPCSDVIYDFDDKIFTNVNNGACKSIFRTWTLIDQCSLDTFDFTQKLHIKDHDKPVFDNCSNDIIVGEVLENCLYEVTHSTSATDDCTIAEDLYYEYSIDVNNNGSTDFIGTGSTFTRDLPAGTHMVKWIVHDDCDNHAACTEFITIEDEKNPSPYCLGGISTVIMPSTGTIAIWAEDFNAASEDNCTSMEDLRYSFSPNVNEVGRTFTCDDLEGLDEKLFPLEIYVHDEAGNYDFCSVTLRITSNNGSCDTSSMLVDVSGLILTEDNEKMENVEVELSMKYENYMQSIGSNEQGLYAFQDLEMMNEYVITPSYEDDYLNGITTLDIVLIQKHILGIDILDSPYKVIAADVNNSGDVSGIDIIQLRKLILGYYDELPDNNSWVFVDAQQQFINSYNPWPYRNKLDVYSDKSHTDMNFISIKVGDINLTREMNFQEDKIDTRSVVELKGEWTKEKNGWVYRVSLENELPIYGFQFELETQMGKDLMSIESESIDITLDHLKLNDDGILISYSQAYAKRINKELFSLYFGPRSPEEIRLKVSKTNEIYTENVQKEVEVNKVELRSQESYSSFKLNQNTPNPFFDKTEISYQVNKIEDVVLEIHNLDGSLVYRATQTSIIGNNSFLVSKNQLAQKNGTILFYTISINGHRLTKKMIVLQ